MNTKNGTCFSNKLTHVILYRQSILLMQHYVNLILQGAGALETITFFYGFVGLHLAQRHILTFSIYRQTNFFEKIWVFIKANLKMWVQTPSYP